MPENSMFDDTMDGPTRITMKTIAGFLFAIVFATNLHASDGVILLPMAGITALRSAEPVMNTGIIGGIVLDVVTWTTFGTTLILRAAKKTSLYQILIAASQVFWFIAYVSFVLGMHKFT